MSVSILDQWGNPLPPPKRQVAGNRPRPRAMMTPHGVPYDAADVFGPQMELWRPYLWSPDVELGFAYRDRIVSRARDAERNDGWAKAAITRIADATIGANFRPVSKPDYRALAFHTGISAFDAQWAREYGRAVDACWRTWADDINHYCDVMECLPISLLCHVGMRHALLDGDALGVMAYRPERITPGGPRYATAVQLIDPDRLSNPQFSFDQQSFRGGVEVDEVGRPVGYWIRRAHAGDWWAAAKSMTWDFYPRRTDWGRAIVLHTYDHDRAGQHHGGAGVLTPILQRLKMLVRYDSAELEAAIINAIYASYIKSPYDPQMVEETLGKDQPDETALGWYQEARAEWWEGRRMAVGDSQMTHLFPGEEIGQVNGGRPTSQFEPFESTILRHVAAGVGITYEQLTGDFSRTNFSSFRGATNEVLKTFERRGRNFDAHFVAPMRAAAVEEFHDVEDLPLPAGAPDFAEFRAAYSCARWLRPGRGWTNPLDEIRASALTIHTGISSLESEAACQTGSDWEEIMDQRAIEQDAYLDRGLPLPAVYQEEQVGEGAGGRFGSGGNQAPTLGRRRGTPAR